MEPRPRRLLIYETEDGRRPFAMWMDGLRGSDIHAIVLTRMDRVELGNLGDWGTVGEGVYELRIHLGPGYRVYFGQDGDDVILLTGSKKSKSQSQDIAEAKAYWRDYNA
jgi:putative addiction module killer protein